MSFEEAVSPGSGPAVTGSQAVSINATRAAATADRRCVQRMPGPFADRRAPRSGVPATSLGGAATAALPATYRSETGPSGPERVRTGRSGLRLEPRPRLVAQVA